MGCVWVLTFALLRTMIEQMDFTFEIFDPINPALGPKIPRLDNLPNILEKATRLSQIDRYLSRLEEFLSFFLSVWRLSQGNKNGDETDTPPYRSHRFKVCAELEASRTQNKVFQVQRFCQTYIKQFENLVQTVRCAPTTLAKAKYPVSFIDPQVISYSATLITERLDLGSKVGEQLAKIGMFIAGVAGVVAPLSLLTSFYGMNVKEFNGGSVSLFQFWRIGLPMLLFPTVFLGFFAVWMSTNTSRRR